MEILVRFIQGKEWDSRLIEWRTGGWCSHVEAVIPDTRLTIGAMLNGGVAVRRFDDKCYRDVKRWEIWRIPCTAEQQRAYYEFLHSQIGKPYDWRVVFTIGISNACFKNRNWKSEDAWFCSELQPKAALKSGLFCVGDQMPANIISPAMCYAMYTTQRGAHV